MACSSGNSSGLQNSGSEENLQVVMDQRKRKRMESNRESARRSRMRKQKHLDDLMSQIAQLKKENSQIVANISITSEQSMKFEFENSVLRAQMAELSQRLQSLNDILTYMSTNSGFYDFQTGPDQTNFISNNNPLNLIYLNQPIMASADLLQY